MGATLREALDRAAGPAGSGIVVGGLAGLAGIVAGDGLEPVAAIVARGYLLLAVVAPVVLLLTHWLDRNGRDRSLGQELALAGLAAVLAALGASLFFLFPAMTLPALFEGFPTLDFQQALLARIGWGGLAVVLAVTGVAGVAAALWEWRRPG